MSAHLKFGGRVLSVCFFLQLGQTCDFATSFSPRLPDFWLRVAMRERLITKKWGPSGAMVSRYMSALSGDLAVEEF